MRLALLPTALTVLLAGCVVPDRLDAGPAPPAAEPVAGADGTYAVTIGQVQGPGPRSPLEGRNVLVEGVVSGVFGGLGGVFVSSFGSDADPRTAEGVWVPHPKGAEPRLRPGDRVQLLGTVRELGDGDSTLTSIEPTRLTKTGTADVPVLVLTAPPAHGWESYEGQPVRIEAPLTVNDTGGLYRYGELATAFGGRVYAPTERAPPGPEAQALAADNARRGLRIDDARQATDVDTVWYLPAHDDDAPLRAGSTVGLLEGVVDERFGSYRLQLTKEIGHITQAPRPAPPTVPGDRRIAGFNVLNLFNGDGAGGGFPTERGAASRAEYDRQQAKLVAVVQALDPDLAALMELENDGYGPRSSLAQFVDALNAAGPHGDWRFVDAGEGPGTNPIRVGIVYRAGRFTPVGAPATLTDGPFAERSRAPLVQAFRASDGRTPSGPVFVVAANHFKSKGCGRDPLTGGDADSGDGQACFNATRVESARRLHDWLATDPTGTGATATLVLGDLNAHAQEDPLRLLRERGWRDAFAGPQAEPPYSFIFAGQSARLDHALVDAGLAGRLRAAVEWHNSADESDRFDYRLDDDADPWRASDHDPMLLGFDLAR